MKVKNISARPHHVGNVLIAPGATEEIDDAFKDAINKNELVAPNGKAAKAAEAAEGAEETAETN